MRFLAAFTLLVVLQTGSAQGALNPEVLARIRDRSHQESSSALIISEAGTIRIQEIAEGTDGKALTVQSISKTITTLLYLLALNEGRVASLDTKLSRWYPAMREDSRSAITVRSVLTHSSGFDDSDSYWDQADPMAFALQQRPKRAPFQYFSYSSMAYNFMGDVLDQITGGTEAFLASRLFAPLGISHWSWRRDGQGHLRTSGGVFLEPQDLHRLGLYLMNAVQSSWAAPLWDSRQGTSSCYGTGIWVLRPGCEHGDPTGLPGTPTDGYFAAGFGGQYIVIIPSLKIVAIRALDLPASGEDLHPFNDFPMLVRRLGL